MFMCVCVCSRAMGRMRAAEKSLIQGNTSFTSFLKMMVGFIQKREDIFHIHKIRTTPDLFNSTHLLDTGGKKRKANELTEKHT